MNIEFVTCRVQIVNACGYHLVMDILCGSGAEQGAGRTTGTVPFVFLDA